MADFESEDLAPIVAALEASNVYLARIAAAVEAMVKVQRLWPPPRRSDAPPGASGGAETAWPVS